MNQLSLIVLLSLSLHVFSQSTEHTKYNINIIDSCISKIDTSYKVIEIRFINGKDPEFEQTLIDSLRSLKFIDYFLYDQSPDNSKYFVKLKGVSISFYYDSTSCILHLSGTGDFSIDSLTGSLDQIFVGSGNYFCWYFSNGKSIVPCN